jgi:AcrR family transcriptional regulator
MGDTPSSSSATPSSPPSPAFARRAREKALRRELLLEAAGRVFGRKPFDEATLQEVATEAGIGMQGLYEHFPSKQELYVESIDRRAEELKLRLDRALADLESPVDQIATVAREWIDTLDRHPEFLVLFVRERVQLELGIESRFGPAFRAIHDRERRRVGRIIARGVDSGLLRPLEVDFLSHFFGTTLQAILVDRHRSKKKEGIDSCLQRFLEAFLGGVGAPK